MEIEDLNCIDLLEGSEESPCGRDITADLRPMVNPDTANWPEPKPITGELRPVPIFDAEILLPDVFRPWIVDEAERMPCPIDFLGAALVVGLSSVIGAKCAMRPKENDPWAIIANLWGGMIGDPSAMKTPASGVAFKPMDRLIKTASEGHQAAMAEFHTEQFMRDTERECLQRRYKAAARSGDSIEVAKLALELHAFEVCAPPEPILKRYKTNDTTVEKLGELLRDNPAGILVIRDELTGLISSWEKEGREGDRTFFLEAWNGNQSYDTDRIGRGHISIPNICVAIFGGMQPDKLVAYLEQAAHSLQNDGMLQRFQVLVYPDARSWEWRDRCPDRKAREAACSVFSALADFDPLEWGAAPPSEDDKFPFFNFDQAAQDVFIAWSTDLHTRRLPAEDQPLLVQHLAKFDKLFPALALIFHLVNCAAADHGGPVTLDCAVRAAAWCDYLEAHARRCFGLLKDAGLRAAQALSTKIKNGNLSDGFTLRDVRRHQWRSLTSDDVIGAALDWLEDENWVRSESTGGTGPGTGRRTLRYRLHPSIQGVQVAQPE